MGHQPGPLLGCGRKAVDKEPLVELEGQREAQLPGKGERMLEIRAGMGTLPTVRPSPATQCEPLSATTPSQGIPSSTSRSFAARPVAM